MCKIIGPVIKTTVLFEEICVNICFMICFLSYCFLTDFKAAFKIYVYHINKKRCVISLIKIIFKYKPGGDGMLGG